MKMLIRDRIVIFIRSLLVYFPWLDDYKIFFQRIFWKTFNIPFDKDFLAIRHFPDIKDALYLDIGGNRGFAIDAILMFNDQCNVYSFEPNPVLAEKTRKRFKSNQRVKIYNWGLGNDEGEFTLFVPVYRGYEFSGLASLLYDHAESWLKSNNLYFYSDKNLSIREHKCAVKKLDDLKLEPFFMKLDVQGYEYQVLSGARNTIAKYTPILLVESVRKDGEIMHLLAEWGYRLYKYENDEFVRDECGKVNSFLMTDSKYNMLKHT